MAANRGSRRSGTGRPKASVSPAQRRRQQIAAAAATDRPTTGPARRKPAVTLPDAPRWTRDRILGWGSGVGAVLALASLTPPALALFFGLLYGAVAFLRPSDRKQTQLTVSTAAIALWVLISTVVLAILVATTVDAGAEEQAQDISLTGSYLAISLASGVMITLAVALAAIAFYSAGRKRYLLFTWSGLCLTLYYILFLPSAVGEASAPSTLGSFWADPVSFGRIFFGIIAGLAIAAAFWWYGGSARDDEAGEARQGSQPSFVRFPFGEREYLLAIAAALLLLARLVDFAFVDWGSFSPSDDQTTSGASFQVLLFLAVLLRLPVLFGAAALAFWTSARQAGWAPARLLQSAPTDVTSSDVTAGEAGIKALTPRPLAERLLLTWRLPLILAWLVVLMAVSSFLGWYGFLAALPAAAHYLLMRGQKREIPTDPATGSE